MLRNSLFALFLFIFSSVAKPDEVLCHFSLETDDIGSPSCDGRDCVFEINFPDYEASRILRASLEHQQGKEFFKAELALEKFEEKAHATIYFSKGHTPMVLEVFYQLNGCIGRTKYEIRDGNLVKTQEGDK